MANVEQHEVLLRLYEIERQDDLSSVSVYAVLLSAWLALLGVIGYVLLRDTEQPGWLLAFMPIAPLPLAGLGALLLAAGSARACLLDDLESELQQLEVRARNTPVPSFHTISRGEGARRFSIPIFVLAVYAPLVGLYIAVAAWSLSAAWDRDGLLAILGALAFTVPMASIAALATRSVFHRRIWREEAETLASVLRADPRRRSAAETASSEARAAR